MITYPQFIKILDKASKKFGLSDPDIAYMKCSDFSFAAMLVALEIDLTEVSVITCEVSIQTSSNNFKVGEKIHHALLKINGEYYDYTIAQIDSSQDAHLGFSVPEYYTNLVTKEKSFFSDKSNLNNYHTYIWKQVSEILEN